MKSGSAPKNKIEKQPLKVALVQRNPWLLALSGLPLVVVFGLIGAALSTGSWVFAGLVPQMLFLAGTLYLVIWIRNPRPREVDGLATVDKEGVRVGQTLVLPRKDIKAGFVVPRPDKRPLVALEKRRKLTFDLEIAVDDEEKGRRVLRRLGLDATQTIASFVLPSRLFTTAPRASHYVAVAMAIMVILGLTRILLHSHVVLVPLLVGLVGIGFVTAGYLTRIHLSVGADGIALRSLRWRRFVPFDEIASIESYEEKPSHRGAWAGVRLRLRSGKVITLPISSPSRGGLPRVNLVSNRLRQAFADHKRARPSAQAHLSRGKREMREWVRELRSTGTGANVNHRVAPVTTERLLEVVEDRHADPVVRANAAVALGAKTEDREIRSRLRVAAQVTAAPRLRVALEKAAETDDEEALAEALAEVEADAKKKVKKK